jgi:murein tripeptide amidase MpaA
MLQTASFLALVGIHSVAAVLPEDRYRGCSEVDVRVPVASFAKASAGVATLCEVFDLACPSPTLATSDHAAVSNATFVDRAIVCGQEEHALLSTDGVEYDVTIPDLFAYVREERLSREQRRFDPDQVDPEAFFEDFQPLESIIAFSDWLAETHPDLVTKFVATKTFEGRDVFGYRVSAGPGAYAKAKPAIWFEGQVHAGEWLATPTLLYSFWQILQEHVNGVSDRLEAVDFLMVPLVNYDGYVFSWSDGGERFWRKNRRQNGSPGDNNPVGVDLNRNWGPAATHCVSGSSTSYGSNNYCGTGPFSEPEIQGLANILDANSGTYKAGVDFHCSGPKLLYPWQWQLPPVDEPDLSELRDLGDAMVAAMETSYGVSYQNQQGASWYAHSGGFIDYNYEVHGMLTYTWECRTGYTANDILPSGVETYQGMKVLIDHVIANN